MEVSEIHYPCFGCSHSDSGTPYPGRPSGEAPCCVCKRCPNAYFGDEHFVVAMAQRFGIPPGKTVDMYIALDRAIVEARGRQTHHPWHDVANFRLSCEKDA